LLLLRTPAFLASILVDGTFAVISLNLFLQGVDELLNPVQRDLQIQRSDTSRSIQRPDLNVGWIAGTLESPEVQTSDLPFASTTVNGEAG
jgi:hypothetical protein